MCNVNYLLLGSFGSFPNFIKDKFREYQDQCEARPDVFIRYEYPKLLDESREAVAKVINASVDDVVFVSNATTGVNTVFRNLKWNDDGKDVILSFSTVYEACGKVADYMVDYFGKVEHREIELEYPLEDEDIVNRFRAAVEKIEADGKRARICIIDVVSSRPGLVFPWQDMVKACRELGVISMVDGAQGIGQVKLDFAVEDPDFFVSNCHKWLHVPRGCAVFYVPKRNQHLLPTTLTTSHGYVPQTVKRISPLPTIGTKSPYVRNFEFVGTVDNTPYLCVKDAVAWRQEMFGGEDKVLEYLWRLNKEGIALVAEALDTPFMENSKGTMTNCGMANVALPIWTEKKGPGAKETDTVLSAEESGKAFQWFLQTLISDYKTFMSLFIHGGRFWCRISAQVYIDLDDYKWAAKVLKELCERVAKGEFK